MCSFMESKEKGVGGMAEVDWLVGLIIRRLKALCFRYPRGPGFETC